MLMKDLILRRVAENLPLVPVLKTSNAIYCNSFKVWADILYFSIGEAANQARFVPIPRRGCKPKCKFKNCRLGRRYHSFFFVLCFVCLRKWTIPGGQERGIVPEWLPRERERSLPSRIELQDASRHRGRNFQGPVPQPMKYCTG